MNINYQFSDVIGSVYKNGNVHFLPDGNSVLSPIGNKLKLFQLKQNLSRTLRLESNCNITVLAVNSSGSYAMVVTDDGNCLYVNINKDISLFTAHIGRTKKIRCLAFSPDERTIAICTGGHVKIISLANYFLGQFRPFQYLHIRRFCSQPMNSVDWSADGRLLVCGGEDRIVRVFAPHPYQYANVPPCTLLTQERSIVGAFFYGTNHYNIASINRGGTATVYECLIKAEDLIPVKDNEMGDKRKAPCIEPLLRYSRIYKVPIYDKCDSAGSYCNASACNRQSGIFVAGFSNGVFAICQLPEFSIIQSFRAGDQQINSLDFNRDGSWLAVGCGQGFNSQLIVWEWQSETYVLKQQSHDERIMSASYSPDGSLICTGAEDGKVKIWNCLNSFCLVTFTEHESGVSDVCFTQSGKAILSASLDGTVRAHDLKRYRNFRTMAAPKQTQLNNLCTDSSGELVIAASRDSFEIYVWNLDTGNILDVLTGHTDAICGISCHESTLASTSMDKTLRLWNIVEGSGGRECIQLTHEGLDVQHSPCGHILAVLCYDSCINLFHTATNAEIGTIETKLDIDAARGWKDHVKKETSQKNKSFTCIAFSPDSLLLLAGGQSNTFCLYSVTERLLLKQFKVSANISLDGVLLDMDHRRMTEYGNVDLFDCSDSEEEAEERKKNRRLKLPGTQHTDLSERSVKPLMRISRMTFNPTGRSFAVVSTEGVSIYALNVRQKFDPFELQTDITPKQVKALFNNKEYRKAVCLALRLNESELVQRIVESIPLDQVKVVINTLDIIYAEKLLKWIASLGDSVLSKNLQFYQIVIHELLYFYGSDFKQNLHKNLPSIIAIQQTLNQQINLLVKLCNQNQYSIEYLIMARRMNATICKIPKSRRKPSDPKQRNPSLLPNGRFWAEIYLGLIIQAN